MNYKFDEKTGSFLLFDPETGKKWRNYFWDKTDKGYFITESDHFGGTSSWLLRDTSEQIYLTDKSNPSCIYLRNDENGDFWNPGVSPTCSSVQNYCCEHGLKFTSVSCENNGIAAEQRVAALPGELAQAWKLTLKNTSDSTKKISVFAFSHFDLNGYMQPRYYYAGNTGATRYVNECNAVFCQQINPFMPEDIFSGFMMSSEKPAAFEGRIEKFFGTAGGYALPKVLKENTDLSCCNAAVRERSGILQNKVELKPGEEKTIYYVLGFAASSEKKLIARHRNLIEKAKVCFDCIYELGISEFGSLHTNCPESRINNIMNFWTQKQVCYCMLGKKAVRDNSQLVLAMLNYDTLLAKTALIECLKNQYADGHSKLTWSIGAEEREIYSDPSAWLAMAVCAFIKETGELDFANVRIPFADADEATVYEHLQAVAEWYMRPDNFGPNGLPKIHHADWNDALNIPDENAESVFLAMLISCAISEIAELSDKTGDKSNNEKYEAFRKKLADTVNRVAWNGDYYIRAFSKNGNIGDKDSEIGGNIYINPQVWAILSGMIPPENLAKLLASIDHMETEYGVPLCDPPYFRFDENVGRMSAMPAGVYENGGIYNHACAFKVMADCKLGRGDNAVSTLLKMIPGGKYNSCEVTTTEPYVFTNCYIKHPAEDMVVGFSWQTGSSAWALRDYYEGILGITREFNGLRIAPCIPENWKCVKVERNYRGSRLNITVNNLGGKSVSLLIDGLSVKDNLIPDFKDGAAHQIVVNIANK